jgi:transcriptional regulator EpsA
MNIEQAPALGVELEKLLLVIQTGLRVRLRHHFFNWTQGPLQTLLPHDLLVCSVAEQGSGCHKIDSISCYPQSPNLAQALERKDAGITVRLVQAWEKSGRDPVLFDHVEPGGVAATLAPDFAEHKLGSIVAHGSSGPDGQASTFFMFSRFRVQVTSQHALLSELIVPYLHAAWIRTQHHEVKPSKRPVVASTVASISSGVLTVRELEILRWVYEGKSNMEIGMILGISGLTVKNHVQNILRKLNVQNRTQAVAKGMLMQLLRGVVIE